jgi:hypothetical protein
MSVNPGGRMGMGDDFPAVFAGKQRFQKLGVQFMSRFVGCEVADDGHAQEIEIPDGIQDLVFDKLIG